MLVPYGGEPDYDHDRGVSDEEFASVVFDEAFIGAAVVHEPTAVERLLAAARARAEASEAEAHRTRPTTDRYGGHGRYGRRHRGDGPRTVRLAEPLAQRRHDRHDRDIAQR
ncbi:hypothetical protein SHIRM173S_11785 [Streptomyces hirsutus]